MIHEVPLNRRGFLQLREGDKIVDAGGRKWDVVESATRKVGDSFPTVIAQCPGYESETLTLHPDLGIVDENWGTIMELNPKGFKG